ncbi:MAG: hypothetical protein EBQ92_07285 [Proteobacteria bacterium]|nr:hypothetical protein [Pseudomonadota bacterium]
MNSPFIPVGSGQVLPWETHPSLALIHQLKLFNFPIPNGIILIHPNFNQEGLDPHFLEELQEEIRQRELTLDLTLTAFGYEENASTFTRPCTLETLGEVFRHAIENLSQSKRIDFLILERIQGLAQGRAFSQAGYSDDWIEFQLGTPEDSMPVTKTAIEKLSLGETRLQGDFRGRVQDLLRSVRRALGEDNWRIDWIDSNENIFLTSIEKTSPSQLDEDLFLRIPNWENTPDIPGNLEGTVISACSPKLFEYFHHWAPELSGERPFVIWRRDQLLFNASLVNDFLRSFGLSTSSVKLIIPDLSSPAIPLNTVRFWRSLPRLFRFTHDLTLGPGIAYRLIKKLNTFQTNPEKPFAELFQEWQRIVITSSHAQYRLSTAILMIRFGFALLPLGKLESKVRLAETLLRNSSLEAVTKVYSAIQIKALGWYSRGLLPSDEAIWNMSQDQILDLEGQLE